MPRDRRRGRRPHRHQAPRPSPAGQDPRQPASPSKQVPAERLPPIAKAQPTARQAVVANPHLGKDLRNIGIVTVVLVILLIVLSIVL